MGSAGTGRFENYNPDTVGDERKNGYGGTGSNQEIECPQEIELIKLEDVGFSEYCSINNTLQNISPDVILNDKIVDGRLVIRHIESAYILGNMPTKYNFLLKCIDAGHAYSGKIVAAGDTPVPFVTVKLNAK